MSIAHYIKEIGRGKDGARSLTREQAADLLGMVLDGVVSDLEIGAFCLAMRIKGETPEELMGFVDAAEARLNRTVLPDSWDQGSAKPVVVIPSYNGARKLPVLVPLLAALLEREGCLVLVHGIESQSAAPVNGAARRVTSAEVFELLDLPRSVVFTPIGALSPTLAKLLAVRQVVGLRNSAHSVVKLINPYRPQPAIKSILVTSYTHPEYAVSMNETLAGLGSTALLLRGTEGEAVADPRRIPPMIGLRSGQSAPIIGGEHGTLGRLPALPASIDAPATAAYIRSILSDALPVPPPIALQVQHILKLA